MLKIVNDHPELIKSPRRKKHSLVDFFMMKEDEVLDTFATLPNAIRSGQGDAQYVYVPGTRKNKVLLVAHCDTVFGDNAELEIGYYHNHYFSLKQGVGIGADDRAGCAMLWQLRSLGHSLLIPNGEESGCVGTKYLITNDKLTKEINDHNFVIEMDRMNDKDLVFYSVGSSEFTEWCEKEFRGYKYAMGSFTDICYLCETVCGLNISIGYYNQHGDSEALNEKAWNRTLNLMREVLTKTDLPQFRQPKREVYNWRKENRNKSYHPHGQSNHLHKRCSHQDNSYNNYHSRSATVTEGIDAIAEALVVCPWCDFVQDFSEWEHNQKSCISCERDF